MEKINYNKKNNPNLNMKKIKVALDVDGVLLNFMQTISDFIVSHYQLEPLMEYSPTQYNLATRFNEILINDIGFDNVKKEFEITGHWKKLQAMPHIELIQDILKDPIFEIAFVTSLPPHLVKDRHHNLSTILNANIEVDSISCVPLGESKKPYIEKFNPDFFVEDNLHNLIDCKGEHKSLWINLKEVNFYDQHNPEEHEIHTINNFNEAAQFLLDYAKEYKLANAQLQFNEKNLSKIRL